MKLFLKAGRRRRSPKKEKKNWLDSLFKKFRRTKRRQIKQSIRQPRKLGRTKNSINYRSFLRSRLFNVLLMMMVVYMAYLTGQESLINFYQSKDIAKVVTENNIIRQKNQELFYLLEYYETETYAEMEARKHLNLKKPGEKVAVIEVDMVDVGLSYNGEAEDVKERQNYEKWWDFLFADLDQLPNE